MKPKIQHLLLLALLLGMLPLSCAQETGLSTKDIESLSKLLSDWRSFPVYPKSTNEEKKKDAAQASFFDAVTKAQSAYEGDILRFTDSWRAIFRKGRLGQIEKSPSGSGFLKEGSVSRLLRGREFAFEYAINVPKGYTSAEKWPLILALHDDASSGNKVSGEKYLKEVWLSRDLPRDLQKEIQQTYILLAPTIGEKTAGKSSDQQRITWFDDVHRRGIAMCLIEVLSKYNVDMDRIYVEGTGIGGTTAIELKKMWPSWFAAAVSRNGLPATSAEVNRDPAFVNLAGQGGIMFVTRQGELFASDEGKVRRAALDSVVEKEKVDIRIKGDYEAIPPDKMRSALGSQKSDPVHDATPDIVEFLKSMKRNRTPSELTYVTYDNRSFSECAWVRLEVATASPKDGTFAEIRAKVNSETNTIEVKSNNVESFRIVLSDDLLNLDKPVAVVVNGKEVARQEVTRSLDYLLGVNSANSHDPDKLAVGQLIISVPVPEEGK
jgi:hypothetical protein